MSDTEDRSLPVVLERADGEAWFTATDADAADHWVATGHWKVASKSALRELEKSDAVPAPGTGTTKEK